MLHVFISLISILHGIEPKLSIQMAKVESNFNPKAFSHTKDGGLFQLNTRFYKFHNPEWIFDPYINTYKAIQTITKLKEKCRFKLNNQFVLCYNMGVKGASKLKHPENQTYLKKLTFVWKH